MPVPEVTGIIPYGLAGNWCEECGNPKSQRLFGMLTGCKACDDAVTRHRCTSRPDLADLAGGEAWECPDCGSRWTPRSEERDCGDCCAGCGHRVTVRLWDSEEGPRIGTAPRRKPEPWTPLRGALREMAAAAHGRPFRNEVRRPGSCYRTGNGSMVHVKPGCRCPKPG